MNELKIRYIQDAFSMNQARLIRKEVFCDEQKVSEEGDWDNRESFNYLAILNGKPVGTIRWRIVGKAVKIERLCVLKDYRNKKIARTLMEEILKQITFFLNEERKKEKQGLISSKQGRINKILLHAQLPVIQFYESLGFEKKHSMFEEEGIKHFTMIKTLE
ncbi:MAG: GNAT family N-acetyltransferase [Bacteroidales bacterium]|nr:GNAT family N-acetyltransferase [Bacteroidales bacterium]